MKIRKSVFVLVIATVMLFSSALGAVASTGIERIEAALNHNIKFLLNGSNWAPKDGTGKALSALVYNGSTYVPLRAVSEALGASVNYDSATSVITINGNSEFGVPYLDGKSNGNTGNNSNAGNTTPAAPTPSTPSTPTAPTTTPTASASSATMAQPVPFGQTYSYSDHYNYGANEYTADYTATVTKVTPLSLSQLQSYGFDTSEVSNEVEYVQVKLRLTMKNANVLKTDEKDGLMTSVYFSPNIWGSKATNDKYVIGKTDFGFEGSLNDAFFNKLRVSTVNKGQTASYEVEGDVILPIVKGATNYLVLRKDDDSNYEASLLHFKLK